MKVYLGTDHAGFELKEKVKEYLQKQGHEVEDCGALSFDPADDYPDFISKAAQKVAADASSYGIVFGKSGAGECIVANKIKGVRAAFVTEHQTYDLVKLFLETPFSNEERHKRRIEKIRRIEDRH
ncbi:MAG: RpiB/LacA/LacB family sugar-phosphate isomerase [Candidatus Levybacteria bacterium]|nr:RpiB/LacA/LacB family sugar-phosphate isomerase [Candidatus Levybacteria bacterium]